MGDGYEKIKRPADVMFKSCMKILQISIYLEKIQMNAFKNCRKLIFNTFPSSVEYIGYSSFNGCGAIFGYIHDDPRNNNFVTLFL